MSSAINKNKKTGFFTCSCEEGLLKVDFDKETIEFGFYFSIPCIQSLRDRIGMAWDILMGKYTYYLTLKKKDALKLGTFLLHKSGKKSRQ